MPDLELERVVEQLRRRSTGAAARWLEGALVQTRCSFDRVRFLAAYAAAARKVATRSLGDAREPLVPGALAELARAALLRSALAALPEAEHAGLVAELYRRGDNAERAAALRSLASLPGPERYLATAIEACRSHVQTVFEAIACENPYPARHFPAAAFQQLVLKALFTGVPLARIVDLAARCDAELARMAADYARERRAAGRDVSQDVERLASGALAASTGDP
jgi:hypothetical protein